MKLKKALPAAIILLAVLLADLLSGGVSVGMADMLRALAGKGEAAGIILSIRLPRVLTAAIAGAALSLSGAQMQAVFSNPLADPHIMGVSGGAGLGAALMTLGIAGSSVPGISLALAAFIGAAGASALVMLMSGWLRSGTTLLIFGVMAGFIFSALTSVLEYTANEESLKLFYSWAAGSFSSAGVGDIAIMAAALVVGAIMAAVNVKGLDIILFGDEFAALSGASPRAIRMVAVAGCCIMTGAVTAFCGPIGFVGIAAPHLSRRITGSSAHGKVIPWSMFCGSILTVCADIIANAFRVPLPPGSTVALIGIPLILAILLRRDA